MDKVALQDESRLADDAMAAARAEGWALFQRMISRKASAALRDEVLRLAVAPERHLACRYFYSTSAGGERRLSRIEHIWESLPSLGGPVGDSIRQLAEAYFGEPAVLFKDKINFRYPGSEGYAPHQDAAAGWIDFADRFVSLSPFLAASDYSRGGFEIAGDCHRLGRFANDNGRMSEADFEALGPVELRAGEGDLLLLDGETPHRTGQNGADSTSLHLLFTFVPAKFEGAREAYFAKKFSDFAPTGQPNTYEFRVFKF